MRELVDVQDARKINWPTLDGPADKELEFVHRRKISAIRKQLSARQHELAGISEPSAGPDPISKGGVVTGPAASLLSLFKRRIFLFQKTIRPQ